MNHSLENQRIERRPKGSSKWGSTSKSTSKGGSGMAGMAAKRRAGRASRWFLTALGGGYAVAIIWTSLAYAMENRANRVSVPRESVSSSEVPADYALMTTSRLAVRRYVQARARAAGVDPTTAEWIVAHESAHRPQATGDGGESRGLWQINRVYHPEVSDRCAYDVACSTRWSLERIRGGNVNEWSTWKNRQELAAERR